MRQTAAWAETGMKTGRSLIVNSHEQRRGAGCDRSLNSLFKSLVSRACGGCSVVRCYILLSPDDGQHQKRGVVAAAVVGAEK